MYQLIKPTKVTIRDLDETPHEYTLGRFPAVEGLEIIAKVPSNIASLSKQLPNLRGLVLQMCKFVSVEVPTDDGGVHQILLSTSELVDNHVPDGQTLLHLCFEIMRHNTSFFGTGSQSALDFLGEKAADLLPKIIRTSTELWASYAQNDTQHIKTCKQRSTSKAR